MMQTTTKLHRSKTSTLFNRVENSKKKAIINRQNKYKLPLPIKTVFKAIMKEKNHSVWACKDLIKLVNQTNFTNYIELQSLLVNLILSYSKGWGVNNFRLAVLNKIKPYLIKKDSPNKPLRLDGLETKRKINSAIPYLPKQIQYLFESLETKTVWSRNELNYLINDCLDFSNDLELQNELDYLINSRKGWGKNELRLEIIKLGK